METKAPLPLDLLPGEDVSPLIRAYFELNYLKQLYRQGWLRRGVPPERCESVAEHTFGVALLAMFLADEAVPKLDPAKTLSMALLHDFGEIYAGDLTPHDAVDAGEKHRREAQSVASVLSKLPNGQQYIELWEEYERGSSPEARLVRQIDRLEMAFQAGVYSLHGLLEPGEFWDSAAETLSEDQLRTMFAELKTHCRSVRPGGPG